MTLHFLIFMEGEGKLIVKLDVGRRSYLTIFGVGVIFAIFNWVRCYICRSSSGYIYKISWRGRRN